MKIVITGAAGLLGWHTQCYLSQFKEVEVVPLDRPAFQTDKLLSEALQCADAVIHLAGRNRGEPDDVATENVAITKRLVQFLIASNETPHVVFASSTQIKKDNPYGRSKVACTILLAEWANERGVPFSNVIFPHLYGEGGRPFYNSVVSTFCHLLATDGEPQIQVDSELNLLHCQDASALIFRLLNENHNGDCRPEGRQIHVSEMLAELKSLAVSYENQIIPDLSDPFKRRLFNTYHSFLTLEKRTFVLNVYSERQAQVIEVIRSLGGGQGDIIMASGDSTIVGCYRIMEIERIILLQGGARIQLRKLCSDETVEVLLNANGPCCIDVPTLCIRSISSVGEKEMIAFLWKAGEGHSNGLDTFKHAV